MPPLSLSRWPSLALRAPCLTHALRLALRLRALPAGRSYDIFYNAVDDNISRFRHLEFDGFAVSANVTIEEQGWNWVTYPLQAPTTVTALTASESFPDSARVRHEYSNPELPSLADP